MKINNFLNETVIKDPMDYSECLYSFLDSHSHMILGDSLGFWGQKIKRACPLNSSLI